MNDLVILELPTYLFQCPRYWINFVRYITKDLNNQGNTASTNSSLSKLDRYKLFRETLIKEYNVLSYDHEFGEAKIIFSSEEDFLFFKLKWS